MPFRYFAPVPAFASLVITLADVSEALKVLTLTVGCGVSVAMFISWCYKARKEWASEKLAELRLDEARAVAKSKVDVAETVALGKLSVAEAMAREKLARDTSL